MAKKKESAPESGSRQLYEMKPEEVIAMLNEQGKSYREKIMEKPDTDSSVYFKDFSDDELFNLFFGLDFVSKSDYAVKSNLSEKLDDREAINYLYEASYTEMQSRLGSVLYGPEYIMNL